MWVEARPNVPCARAGRELATFGTGGHIWLLTFSRRDAFGIGSFLCLPARSRLRHRYSFSARGRRRHGQDKKNVMLISNSFANRRKKRASSMVVGLRIRQLADALLETQLNFVRTSPCQAKDKIRLLIQKLGGKRVRPPVTAMIDKTQIAHDTKPVPNARAFLQSYYCKNIMP